MATKRSAFLGADVKDSGFSIDELIVRMQELVCSKASSFIERTMRELGRRIKKLAYNWKEEGLNKVT